MGTRTSIRWEQFLAAGEEGQRWQFVDGEVEFMSPVNLICATRQSSMR
jgi:hypothetical protein